MFFNFLTTFRWADETVRVVDMVVVNKQSIYPSTLN